MAHNPLPWDALLLSGGTSSRMGQDKHLLKVDNTSLLERTYLAVRHHCQHVLISGDPQGHQHLEVTWCQEDPPQSGPVAAICSALPHLTQPWVMILPCDLARPTLVADYITEQVSTTLHTTQVDAFIARDASQQAQWLTGVYRVSALKNACKKLSTHDISMRGFMDNWSMEFIDAPSDQPDIWEDMDTPEDFSRLTKEQS